MAGIVSSPQSLYTLRFKMVGYIGDYCIELLEFNDCLVVKCISLSYKIFKRAKTKLKGVSFG
jgi:hypothetical protein